MERKMMRKSVPVAALLLAVALVVAVPALAQVPQEEPEPVGNTTVGYVTSISGTQIFVEEVPSVGFSTRDPAMGFLICEEKIYLTVTEETSIFRMQDGELIPASSEDLGVE